MRCGQVLLRRSTIPAEIGTMDFYQYPLLERYGFPPSEPLLTYFREPVPTE